MSISYIGSELDKLVDEIYGSSIQKYLNAETPEEQKKATCEIDKNYRLIVQLSTAEGTSAPLITPSSVLPPLNSVVSDESVNSADLKCNSVNCAYYFDNDQDPKIFTKIQIADLSDPLINEVIYTRVLGDKRKIKLFNGTSIFPEYIKHGLIKIISKNPLQNTLKPFLQTNVIGKGESLYNQILKTPNDNNIHLVNAVKTLLINYMNNAKDLGMTHNDLHLKNILAHKDGSLAMIDFGRCYINPEKLPGPEDITDAYAKFNQMPGVKPLVDNKFNIKDIEYGYMCDIATVTLNVMPFKFYDFPEWFQVSKQGLKNLDYTITIQKNVYDLLTCKNFPKDIHDNHSYFIFYQGLAWVVSYIVACSKYLKDPLTVKDDGDRISITRDELIKHGAIFRNNVFNPMYYNNDIIQRQCKEIYRTCSIIFIPAGTGGKPKKLNRSKHQKKMHGYGSEQFEMDIEEKQRWLHEASLSTHYCMYDQAIKNWEKTKQSPTPQNQLVTVDGKINVEPQQSSSNFKKLLDSLPVGPDSPCAAGGNIKTHKIYIDPTTKRKYIRKSSTRWYLDENRGKYRYADDLRTKIILLGKSKK